MILNIGLCLCGGGAKGAYQAGVIKALYDRGINKFNSIAGTSIGAINGYFLFTENVEKLEEIWTNINKNTKNSVCTSAWLPGDHRYIHPDAGSDSWQPGYRFPLPADEPQAGEGASWSRSAHSQNQKYPHPPGFADLAHGQRSKNP